MTDTILVWDTKRVLENGLKKIGVNENAHIIRRTQRVAHKNASFVPADGPTSVLELSVQKVIGKQQLNLQHWSAWLFYRLGSLISFVYPFSPGILLIHNNWVVVHVLHFVMDIDAECHECDRWCVRVIRPNQRPPLGLIQ